MAFGFGADSEKLQELANDLRDTMSDIDAYVADIYNKVDDLGTVWSGTDYEAFKTRCVNFKKMYDVLLNTLEIFCNETGVMADDAAALVDSALSALDASGVSVNGLNY